MSYVKETQFTPLQTAARMFLALPPFNVPSNIVAGDSYFAQGKITEWGMEAWEEAVARERKRGYEDQGTTQHNN